MGKEHNLGTIERSLRIVGGALAAVVGLVLLWPSPASAVVGGIGIVLILLGADFVSTGVTGYCPLYHRLGRSTAHARRHRPDHRVGHAEH